MNIIEAIKESKVDDCKDAAYWLLWTVVGNLPIWLFLIPLLKLSQSVKIDLAQSGEFALYSVSLLASALYVITKQIQPFGKDKDDPNIKLLSQFYIIFPSQRLLIAIIVILGVISLIPVVITSLAKVNIIQFMAINPSTVSFVTIGTFSFSLLLGFLITWVENSSMKHKLEHMSPQELGIIQDTIKSSHEGIPESLIRDFEELENE